MSAAVKLRESETVAQARTFETVKNHAVTLGGLCYRCACQFAYGVQHGFRTVEAPCDGCVVTMAAWPIPEPQGWRRPGTGATHHRATWEPRLHGQQDDPLRGHPAGLLSVASPLVAGVAA